MTDAFDAMPVGKRVTFSKTVTESDVYLFAGITGDLAPIHVDEEHMTALAVLLSIPVAFLAARNTTFNGVTYALGRLVMSVSRSVDSLIWALIFIIVVGPGSLAGALAVAVRSIGFVSKLFAEAITATGAGRFQVLLYGIVPQIRPVLAGVTIYRWDINIRESTVLGIVGAGGIGFVLNTAILGLEWSRVGLILLVILGVVVVSEMISASLRKRVA
jgi:phosphonate transport system permease protein